MAEQDEPRSLEIRVAALEDRLSKVLLTEEEVQEAQRAMAAGTTIPAPGNCVIQPCIIQNCIRYPCVRQQCIHFQCIHFQCIRTQCVECSCGPCAMGGGGTGIGGFGGLGG